MPLALLAGLGAGVFCGDAARLLGSRRRSLGRRRAFKVWSEQRRSSEALPAISADLATALAAGLRPVEALAQACRHRDDPLSSAAMVACERIVRGEDADASLRTLASRFKDGRVGGMCLALETEIRSGGSALEPILAVARGAAAEAAVGRTQRAARTAPLIQLVVALGLVPSVLLIAAAVALSGVGH
ncbi:MAG: type II secretion system F family protein [Solirubrobacterales bacterium]|nr:type II secretion system F family protein [Solirubrobacterales bacterium]